MSEFERLTNDALDGLPDSVRHLMENVYVVVEDYPSEEVIKRMGLRSRHDLLGLYEGVPQTKRGEWYGAVPVLPDRIILYQRNIERSGREKDLAKKIRQVLVHEIAHHFGMDEEEVRDAGY